MTTRQVLKAAFLFFLVYQGLFSTRAQTRQEIRLERKFTGVGYSLCGSCSIPYSTSGVVRLDPQGEPGDRIVISGTIYKEDGVTPDSGIVLFLYQTDAGGYYHRPQEDVFRPRIFGWVRTGKDGRYEIYTIKPAPEILERNAPAHIHVHIFGNGMSEHFLHEFWFQGDPAISAKDAKRFSSLGNYSPVVSLAKGSDGILRGVRNIRVRPAQPWRYEDV